MHRHAPPRRPRRTVAAGLATLGAGLVIALTATPAYAHDALRSSNPADGATVSTLPSQVVLTFEEPPVSLGAQVVVTGPGGAVTSGSPRLSGDDVIADVQPGAPAGRYTVEWRVTSDDGHPVSGSFAFTAQAGSAGSPASAATPSAAASSTPAPQQPARRQPLIPSWAWIVGGVLIIGLAIRTNRRAKNANKENDR